MCQLKTAWHGGPDAFLSALFFPASSCGRVLLDKVADWTGLMRTEPVSALVKPSEMVGSDRAVA